MTQMDNSKDDFLIKSKGIQFSTTESVLQITTEISQIKNIKKIQLSGNTFGVESCKQLSREISKLSTLQVIFVNKRSL